MNDNNNAALLAEAKSLDTLISNLEVEAFRQSSAGAPHRAMESARRAKDLRERRAAILEQLRVRQVLGEFDSLGAADAGGKRVSGITQAEYEAANRAYVAAEQTVLAQEKLLAKIAKLTAGKALAAAKGIMPDDVLAAYSKMTRASADMMDAAGTREAFSSKNLLRRAYGERLQGQRSLERHEKFWAKLPQKLAKAQAEAFQKGRATLRTFILKRARAAGAAPAAVTAAPAAAAPKVRHVRRYSVTCRPGDRCFKLADRVTAIRRREVSPTKLRAVKRRLALQQGARLPDPIVLRLIANRIAKRYPRPSSMREEVYGDLILELTKRAAIHTANAQAGGTPAPKAAEAAAAQVVSQDLAAVKEEVTTGVSAPAGEQVAAAAVASAAAQVLQGAADAGTMPSVPATPAAVQQQVVQVASAPDPAAAAATTPDVEISMSEDFLMDDLAPTEASAELAPSASADAATADTVTEVSVADDSEPFYKKPLFWAAAAGVVGVGYMVLRKKGEEAGAVPAPAPELAE